MIVAIIGEDAHEARALVLKARDALGAGHVIFTAADPQTAAAILSDLGASKILIIDKDDQPATAPQNEEEPRIAANAAANAELGRPPRRA